MAKTTLTRKLKTFALAVLLAMPFMAAIGLPGSYDRALSNVLVSEGYVYSNVPGDPGGPTKYGITLGDMRIHGWPNATAETVRNLTLADAKEIYRRHYWNAVGGDTLPAGLDYTVFDFAVNAGVGRAMGTLRLCGWPRVASAPAQDKKGEPRPVPVTPAPVVPAPVPSFEHGNKAPEIRPWYDKWLHIFSLQADAAEVGPDPEALAAIRCVNDRRMSFQMGLRGLDKFKRGWANRINSVKAISLQMAGVQTRKSALNELLLIPRLGYGKAYSEEPVL